MAGIQTTKSRPALAAAGHYPPLFFCLEYRFLGIVKQAV
jgi:hypothetical protein